MDPSPERLRAERGVSGVCGESGGCEGFVSDYFRLFPCCDLCFFWWAGEGREGEGFGESEGADLGWFMQCGATKWGKC